MAAEYRFNPAPGWPAAPEGWLPPADWAPPVDWEPAPDGWPLVVPVVEASPSAAASRAGRTRTQERASKVSAFLGYPMGERRPASLYDFGGPSAQIRTAQRELDGLHHAEVANGLLAEILAELREHNALLRESLERDAR